MSFNAQTLAILRARQAPTPAARLFKLDRAHFSPIMTGAQHAEAARLLVDMEDVAAAQARLRALVRRSPDPLGLCVLVQRFHAHRGQFSYAAEWALACMAQLAKCLALPDDWRAVQAWMADFDQADAELPDLWRRSLGAYAQALTRQGLHPEAACARAKLAELDADQSVHLGAAQGVYAALLVRLRA